MENSKSKRQSNSTHRIKIGDKVTYIGTSQEQINWGGNTDPRGVLTVGESYEVEDMEVHSWHTKVYLKGITGKFNSVSFEKL